MLYTLNVLEDTAALAKNIAQYCRPTDCLALYGDVGAGKTTFTRFFLEYLGWQEAVPSPTFTLAQYYETPHHTVWHLDAYRLKNTAEAQEAGLEDCFTHGICVVEWAGLITEMLPKNRLELHFSQEKDLRHVTLIGYGTWENYDTASPAQTTISE